MDIISIAAGIAIGATAMGALATYALNGWGREARDHRATTYDLNAERIGAKCAREVIAHLMPLALIGERRQAQWRRNNAKRVKK